MAACTGRPGATGEAGDPGSSAPVGGIVVELDVFSGRPNPEWTLSATDGARFTDLWRSAPIVDPRSVPNNLGYRGFIVTMPDLGTARVQDGFVQVTGKDGVSYRSDQDRAIERWLLRSGSSQLEDSLVDYVAEQIPR